MPSSDAIQNKLVPISNVAPAIAPLAPSQDTTPDQLSIFYRPASLPFTRHSPLPSNANAALNSNISTISTKIATTIVDNTIKTLNTNTVISDGLTHGRLPWETDPSYAMIREDFMTTAASAFNSGSVSGINAMVGTGFWPTQQNGFFWNMMGGYPPYMGIVTWENNATQAQGITMVLNASQGGGNGGTLGILENSYALLENPGWVATWIWKFDSSFQPTIGGTPSFAMTKKSFYIGLCGSNQYYNVQSQPRPDVFIGLRYDTSATPGTLTLSSVANASGGNTAYTGTITGGANDAYVGMSFTVSGFSTGANNGTFTCVGSSGSTLTLNNPSGASETHAASAAGPSGISDTTYMFEVVENPYSASVAARHNVQGTTHNTSIAPSAGNWCRLDIACTAAGSVTMTLAVDNGNSSTFSFTVGTMAPSFSSSLIGVSNNLGYLQMSAPSGSPAVPFPANFIAPFSAGSKVTISGTSPYNGTYTLSSTDSGASSNTLLKLYFPITAATGSGTYNNTVTGYPSLLPYVSFGNDDTASPTGNTVKFFLDYFSLIWNPALSAAGGSPITTRPRFW